MGSRFSKPAPAYKPPSACIKPPPPPEWVPPELPDRIFQWYVDFLAPHSPYEGAVAGTSPVLPDNPTARWTAAVGDDLREVRLIMFHNDIANVFDFELHCYSGGILQDSYSLDHIPPRSWDPFDTGLLYPEPGPPDGHLRFRVLA